MNATKNAIRAEFKNIYLCIKQRINTRLLSAVRRRRQAVVEWMLG